MSRLICVDQDGRFATRSAVDSLSGTLHVSAVAPQEQWVELLDQPVVRLKVDAFSDGRVFSIGRQLRLNGFRGRLEVIGDLLPDQLPMAVAAGIDVVWISLEHAERCDESQWRQKRGKARFGYQQSANRPLSASTA